MCVNSKLSVEELVLLTNNFALAASTIAAIYKERWQIELFFKLLKQQLKIKTFVGTSANAVRIQIWTALMLCWWCATSSSAPVSSGHCPIS
jgi:IS4 transposase